jgi:hypothetical protein
MQCGAWKAFAFESRTTSTRGEEMSSSGFVVVFGLPPETFLLQWASAWGEGSQR